MDRAESYREILSREGTGDAKVSAERLLKLIAGEKPSAVASRAQEVLQALHL